MRRPSLRLRILALACVVLASVPSTSEACWFYPCGIFGWRCRNYGYPPSYGAPGNVPTSQPVYPPAYAAPAPYYAPPPAYAAPAPRPCPQPCPPPRCVPVCPPVCQPVCPPVCQPVCPSVCPSSCGPSYSTSINCQYPPRQSSARYAPVTAYRRELYSIPVTSYRSVASYSSQYGVTSTYRPVTTFYRSVQSAPYTTYRVISPASPYSSYRAPQPTPASSPAGGCASGNCGSNSEVSAAPQMGAIAPSAETAGNTPKSDAPVASTPAAAPKQAAPPARRSPSLSIPATLPTYTPAEPPVDGPRLPEGTPRTTLRDGYDPNWGANALRASAAPVHQASWAAESEMPRLTEVKPTSTIKQIDGEQVDFGGWRPASK